MTKNVEQYIKENWFNNHTATLQTFGEIKVLDWKEEGTVTYGVRYVLDGNKIYVSGDIGTAVFVLTEKAELDRLSKYYLDYFFGKLMAFDSNKTVFDSAMAVKVLRHFLNRYKEEMYEDESLTYNHSDMKELFEKCRSCSTKNEWRSIIEEFPFTLATLDENYDEWVYSCGDVYNSRIVAYLVGLKMAHEQLTASRMAV